MKRLGRADDPISPRGKAAGLTTGLTVLVVGAATVWAAWAELTCPYGGPRGHAYCSTTVGVGGLFTIAGLISAVAGGAILWSVARRPAHPEGEEGWLWGQGLLVTAGLLTAAVLVHRYTCPPGTKLTAIFPICVGPDDRFAATDRLWIKPLVIAAAPVAGLIVARWRALPWPMTSLLTVAAVGVPFYLMIQRTVRFPL